MVGLITETTCKRPEGVTFSDCPLFYKKFFALSLGQAVSNQQTTKKVMNIGFRKETFFLRS
jgi:hypothetical protein